MNNLMLTGFTGLLLQAAFIALFSLPVWVAARVVGADFPTLLRSVLSLLIGVIGAAVSLLIGGGWGLLLAPLSFLLAFKWVLGTSFFGAVVLAFVALVGYGVLGHVMGSLAERPAASAPRA